MSNQLMIYVSCPYSADTDEQREANVNRAINAAIKIMQKGHMPVIPTLMHYLDKEAQKQGIKFTWQDFMDWCLVILQPCDAILYMASSTGCDIELAESKQTGKKIFYSLEEIPDVA